MILSVTRILLPSGRGIFKKSPCILLIVFLGRQKVPVDNMEVCKLVPLSDNCVCRLQHVDSNLYVKVEENGHIVMSEGHEGDQCK